MAVLASGSTSIEPSQGECPWDNISAPLCRAAGLLTGMCCARCTWGWDLGFLVQQDVAFLPVPLVLGGQPSTKEAMEMVDAERPPAKQNWYECYVLPCLAELLGSAAFVFIGCLSVVEDSIGTGLLQPALVHGLSIVPIVVSLGNIR